MCLRSAGVVAQCVEAVNVYFPKEMRALSEPQLQSLSSCGGLHQRAANNSASGLVHGLPLGLNLTSRYWLLFVFPAQYSVLFE